MILYDGTASDPIMRVPASGGIPAVLVKPETSRKESQVGWPEILPDGKHFLYMAVADRVADSTYRIASLDGKENRVLAPGQSRDHVRASPGTCSTFAGVTSSLSPSMRRRSRRRESRCRVAEQVGTDSVGLAQFSISREGTLAYRTGEVNDSHGLGRPFGQGDRDARRSGPVPQPGAVARRETPRLRRGGSAAAARTSGSATSPAASTLDSRSDRAAPSGPSGPRTGARVVYSVGLDLFEKPTDGQGAETPVFKSDETKFVGGFSPDGRTLVFISRGKDTSWDIWSLPMEGDRKPVAWLQSPFVEANPSFSPDGRYLAYMSTESGRVEVYVQTFPEPGGKWQVSTARRRASRAGGATARSSSIAPAISTSWRSTCRRAPSFQAGIPKPLFPLRLDTGLARTHYLPTKDGQRFLLVATPSREPMTPTTVVLNWMTDLGK